MQTTTINSNKNSKSIINNNKFDANINGNVSDGGDYSIYYAKFVNNNNNLNSKQFEQENNLVNETKMLYLKSKRSPICNNQLIIPSSTLTPTQQYTVYNRRDLHNSHLINAAAAGTTGASCTNTTSTTSSPVSSLSWLQMNNKNSMTYSISSTNTNNNNTTNNRIINATTTTSYENDYIDENEYNSLKLKREQQLQKQHFFKQQYTINDINELNIQAQQINIAQQQQQQQQQQSPHFINNSQNINNNNKSQNSSPLFAQSAPNSVQASSLLHKFTSTIANNNIMNNIANKTTQLFNRANGGNGSSTTGRKYATDYSATSSPSTTSSPASSTSSTSSSSIFFPNQSPINENQIKRVWNYDEAENCWYSTVKSNGSINTNNNNNINVNLNTQHDNSSLIRSNNKIKLTKIEIKQLTLLELYYLKQISLSKYQQLNQNTHLTIPKDESVKSIKQSHFTLRSKSVDYKLAFDDDIKVKPSKDSSKTDQNLVFGQSLHKCILNDMCKYARNRVSSNESLISNNNNLNKRNSVLFEALDLTDLNQINKLKQQQQQQQQQKKFERCVNFKVDGFVPEIVKQCCMHIENYGLNVVGIFRIDSSKRRIKEIRELFDSGQIIQLDYTYNPLDIACLLKEYLRSLPEPLLTRKLYNAFVECSKLKDSNKKFESIKCLISLLPVANRDTLQMILKLLDKLRSYCYENANKQKCGNKMDSFNLAMIFGPNILQKRRLMSNKEYLIDKNALIDDIEAVISMTKYLIENQSHLFYIDGKLHNEVLKKVNEHNPNELSTIMSKKLSDYAGIIAIDSIDGQTDSSGYNTRSHTNTDESSSSSDLCQSNNELDKIEIQTSSPSRIKLKHTATMITTASRTFSTPNAIKLNNSPIYLTMQHTKQQASQQATSANTLYKKSNNTKTTAGNGIRTANTANRNVYIKNRAYFPISHMNKNLINNLNEENNNKTKQVSVSRQPASRQNSLLMIQNQNNTQPSNQSSLGAKAKSLTNLSQACNNYKYESGTNHRRTATNIIHFIGEQETLV